METFEMRYFLGVARSENIHKASVELNVSPGSLSKAIARLEEELAVKLFSREGRGIRLSPAGRVLQKRVSEILALEEAARMEISGAQGALKIILTGPEILLGEWGVSFIQRVRELYPLSQFELRALEDSEALQLVAHGDAHFAFVTSDVPSDLTGKILGESKFRTYISQKHALAKKFKNKPVPVSDLLEHPFVGPSDGFLGQVGKKQSLDGWRDDEFPRRIGFRTSSLKMLEELVRGGQAVAYLPDYYGEKLGFTELNVTGCPYTCTQKIRLVAKMPRETGWMNQVF